ncbi:MAG: endonuclease/exonuclease/phosphatase family protein [Nocardioides sp.]
MTNHREDRAHRWPWRAAGIVVLFVVALALVAQPELPFVGADVPVAHVAGQKTDDPAEIVTSTKFERAQQVVPAPPTFRRAPNAPEVPATGPARIKCVSQEDVTLNVLTFNIHSGLGPHGLNLEQLVREIESWDPDVVLMQEVDRFRGHSKGIDEPAWFAARLGMEFAYGPNESPGHGEIGNATLSRFPIVDETNTHLPNQPGLPDALQRGVLRTGIKVGETVVSVYNTHLQPAYDSLKLSQMQVVGRMLAADSRPMLLGGDFNAVSTSRVMSVARPFLDDAWEAAGTGPDGTSPNSHKARIDHVLYSSQFVPSIARTIESAVSDHRAVGTTLTLSGEGKVCVPVFDKGVSQGDS